MADENDKPGVGLVGGTVALGAGAGTLAAGSMIAHKSAIKELKDENLKKFVKDGGIAKANEESTKAFKDKYKDADALKADKSAFKKEASAIISDAEENAEKAVEEAVAKAKENLAKGASKKEINEAVKKATQSVEKTNEAALNAAKEAAKDAKKVYESAVAGAAESGVAAAAKKAGVETKVLKEAAKDIEKLSKVETAGFMSRPLKAFSNMSTKGKVGMGVAAAVAVIGTGLLIRNSRQSSWQERVDADRAAQSQGTAPAR
ncbi:MAG: hypothetical protein SFW63_01300 [Alphaproteobacteria bacterium]|nr:hypothetical protein [Alphaproteobacteria bacterium]